MRQENKKGVLFRSFPIMCAIWYIIEAIWNWNIVGKIKYYAFILHTRDILADTHNNVYNLLTFGDAYDYTAILIAAAQKLFGGIGCRVILLVAVIWILLFLHHKTGRYAEVLNLLYAGSILYVIYHLLCLLCMQLPAFRSFGNFSDLVCIFICVAVVLIEKALFRRARTKAP